MQAVSFLHLSRKDLHTWNSCQVEDRYHKLFQYFQVWQYHLFQLEWSQQHHPEMNIELHWFNFEFIWILLSGAQYVSITYTGFRKIWSQIFHKIIDNSLLLLWFGSSQSLLASIFFDLGKYIFMKNQKNSKVFLFNNNFIIIQF